MNEYAEVLAIAGTFVTGSFWILRAAVQQQREITNRFILHLEKMLRETAAEHRLHRAALARLTGAVRNNTRMIKEVRYGAECERRNGKSEVPHIDD